MGGMLAAGCLLIAYSPVACLILGYTARRSALLVLTIGAAFAWLLATLATSLVWLAVTPLRTTHAFTAVVSALFQEAMRFLVVWAYVKIEARVAAMPRKQQAALSVASTRVAGAPPALLNDLSAAVACGAGFAAMHTLMAYGALLGTAASVDAAFYWDGCPQVSGYVTSAGTAALATVLHVALQVVAVDAWRRRAALFVALPACLHVAFSAASLMSQGPACVGALPAMAAVAGAAVGAAGWAVRQPGYAARRQARGEAAMAARVRRGDGASAAGDAAAGALGGGGGWAALLSGGSPGSGSGSGSGSADPPAPTPTLARRGRPSAAAAT